MSIIQDAVQAAVGLLPARWRPDGAPDPLLRKHGQIGKPVSRLDGPLKVTGKARFAAEVSLDGLTYAAIAYSTIARGRIARIDAARIHMTELTPAVAKQRSRNRRAWS